MRYKLSKRGLKPFALFLYFNSIIDRTNTTIYIIMEYCAAGDLASLIKERRRARYDR